MRVLIIGSLNGYVIEAAKIAKQRGIYVSHVETIESGLKELREGRGADLVLIDLVLNIKTLVSSLESERIIVPVVACGISVNPDQAAEAIRCGAKEYIPLPPDAEMIAAVLEAVSKSETTLVSKDPIMSRWLELADKIAPSEASVLITGESGTGKEVMARYIHQKSKRAHKQFISINCAAIPENLLESELFGHEKGAFTGAVARRIGKFEEANGGTLLLDEISEMHPRLQAKLLRAIQEKEIDRLGGTHPIKVDIRIIATSNRDLMDSVKKQEFREDLYFRLNVVNIQLPALRERPRDIEALSMHFMKKYARLNHIDEKEFTKEAMLALISHHWNGNVRELENAIHRSLLLAQGEQIEKSDIFSSFYKNEPTITAQKHSETQAIEHVNGTSSFIGKTVSEVEKDLILGTLEHCLGNRTHAANILGISIRTLRNKLKEYEGEQTFGS